MLHDLQLQDIELAKPVVTVDSIIGKTTCLGAQFRLRPRDFRVSGKPPAKRSVVSMSTVPRRQKINPMTHY